MAWTDLLVQLPVIPAAWLSPGVVIGLGANDDIALVKHSKCPLKLVAELCNVQQVMRLTVLSCSEHDLLDARGALIRYFKPAANQYKEGFLDHGAPMYSEGKWDSSRDVWLLKRIGILQETA